MGAVANGKAVLEMPFMEVVVDWTVPQGGSGVSTFAVGSGAGFTNDDAVTATDAIRAAFASVFDQFPSSVSATVRPEVIVKNETNGDLLGTLAGTSSGPLIGTAASSASAAGVGARVRYLTSGVRNSRRVIGTTFLVPLSTSVYEANGTLAAAAISDFQVAFDGLRTTLGTATLPLQVWSRPSGPTATDGFLSDVDGVTVPDRVAWLRSRKL